VGSTSSPRSIPYSLEAFWSPLGTRRERAGNGP